MDEILQILRNFSVSPFKTTTTTTTKPITTTSTSTTSSTTTTSPTTTTTPAPEIGFSEVDFENFPDLPDFDDNYVELQSGVTSVSAENGSTIASDWLKVLNNLSTDQKIVLVTTIPAIVMLIVVFCVIVGVGSCRQQRQANDDVEVILI